MAEEPEDPDLAELARMEAAAKAEAEAPPAKKPVWGEAAADQPFDDEAMDERYERLSDGRTAARAGARFPLMLAAALCAIGHAVFPLATLGEKFGYGRHLMPLADKVSPHIWERLIHTRLSASWEMTALGLFEVVLCLAAVQQAGRRLRVGVQLFAAAAVLNAADWYLLGFDLLHNQALTDADRRGAVMFTALQLALALLLWLRVRPPGGMFPSLRGRRGWE